MSIDLLTQTRAIAESLLLEVVWTSADSGYCRCPGLDLHRKGTSGKRDCIVRLGGDKPPTIYCVHQNTCVDVVAERNHQLRSAIGKAKWEIARGENPALPARPQLSAAEQKKLREKRRLAGITQTAKSLLPQILERYTWPCAAIAHTAGAYSDEGNNGWRAALSLFGPDDMLWIGHEKQSGQPHHADCFRPVADWLRLPSVPAGPLLSASVFAPGSYQRKRENVIRSPFLVVESDTLTRDQIGAVFAWLRVARNLTLRAVIDTGGKSLHGWFDQPVAGTHRQEILAWLTGLGCDPGPWREPCMTRLPGPIRPDKGRPQRLLWLNPSSL